MKKNYWAMLGAFLLIIALCTYASWQNYRNKLPEVQTVEAAGTVLHHVWELSGTLQYDETTEYTLPVPVTVVQWNMQAGDRVYARQPLLQVDTRQLQKQWLQCKIDEEALEKKVRWSESYTKDLLELQLEELQETIGVLENLLEADGWITVEANGVILKLPSNQQFAAGVPLATIGPEGGQKTICFPITEQQAEYCNEPGTELEVTLFSDGKSKVVKLPVDRVFYSAEKDGFLCTVLTDLTVDILDGQKTEATLSATSTPYRYVIPIEAIVANDNGNASFYVLRERESIMGKEYYAHLRTGYIAEQNEGYAALLDTLTDPVIVSATKKFSDKDTVLLAPEGG